MRAFLLLLAGCTTWVAVDLDDTGDSAADTDTDGYITTYVIGLRGAATVDPDAGTWTGTSTAYDEVRTDAGTDVQCALDFASVGAPATEPCADCQFAFAVEHTTATGRTGEQCDAIWPVGHPMTDPAFWDALLGYDAMGPDGAPCLMVFIAAWTDSSGYHEAAWQPVHSPWGTASYDATTGAFEFDYAIEMSQLIDD